MIMFIGKDNLGIPQYDYFDRENYDQQFLGFKFWRNLAGRALTHWFCDEWKTG